VAIIIEIVKEHKTKRTNPLGNSSASDNQLSSIRDLEHPLEGYNADHDRSGDRVAGDYISGTRDGIE
jgi:hypothetical protein